MPTFKDVTPPADGQTITISAGRLSVPDRPIIPFIEGDGTGPDIWRASVRVFDAAVQKAYGGKRKIHWMEVYAGQKSNDLYNTWLPDETVAACREYLVSIKGPLTTPIGGGIRSLNVALRQMLDLYVCLRPVRWFKGVPSPVKSPDKVDMTIFRENTEDIYAGIEFEAGSADNKKFLELFQQAFPKQYAKIRFPNTSGIGIKPVSQEGTDRLFRAAVEYAIVNKRKSVTIVHKGNIMKFTEGAFRNWSYALAEKEFANQTYTWDQWERTKAAKGEKTANEEQDAAKKVIAFLQNEMGVKKVRFPESSGIGIKPVSREGSERLIRAALVPNRTFVNSFGNSFAKKSNTFCASGVPAAYSIPA